MRRRLFVQIYLSFLTVSLLTLIAAGVSVWVAADRALAVPRTVRIAAQVVLDALPDPTDSPAEFRSELIQTAHQLGIHVSIWTDEGRLLGRVGDRLPTPPQGCVSTWVRSSSGRPGACFRLPDGRWVAATGVDARARRWMGRIAGVFFAIFGTIALGCWPLARRITRRLEALQAGVLAFGQGELDSRVKVEGRDEVARVASAFNASADRVADLVSRQRRVLAHASHELRSPLARLRMALALMEDAADPIERSEAAGRAVREIGELDELIEDVLLASRLRGGVSTPRERTWVDLAEVCVSLCERYDATWLGGEVELGVVGDRRLLERALGNLLSNAQRHGQPPIELGHRLADNNLMIDILDRGPGIPKDQRERIFEPFFRPAGHREGDPGVGLGLSLVDEIARHHGGSVECGSRENGGMRFTLVLPAA